MIKKRLNRWQSKKSQQLKENNKLGFVGRHLHHPNLWKIGRTNIANATMVGIFCAFLPIPFQMIVAACFAILLQVNLPLSVSLVWITNPITIPPVFYGCYRLGVFLLDMHLPSNEAELTWAWLSTQMGLIWQPLLFGSLVCGIVFGIMGNLLVRTLWRFVIVRQWKKRTHSKRFIEFS